MNTRTLLFLVGAILALSHLANEWVALAHPGGLVWKAAGIVLLGLYALSQRAWLAGAALLFCATGDVLLELVFVAGMGAFAIGHIFYVLAFLEWGRILGPNKRDHPVAVLVVIVSLILLSWLLPGCPFSPASLPFIVSASLPPALALAMQPCSHIPYKQG